MNPWPWARKPTHEIDDGQLAAARARLSEGRAEVSSLQSEASSARRKLAAAISREQAEVRRNHLGELMHAALATRKGKPT